MLLSMKFDFVLNLMYMVIIFVNMKMKRMRRISSVIMG